MAILTILGGGTSARSAYVYEEREVYAAVASSDVELLRGAIYEWTIGDRVVSTGTANRYMPDDADIGKQISVTALLLDSSGNNTIRLAGTNVKTVAGINDGPTGSLSMQIEAFGSGGVKLTAVDLIKDEDGRGPMSYQWFVDGKPVAGATDSVFVIEQSAGQNIGLGGTYTDNLGHVVTIPEGGPRFHQDTPGTVGILGTVAPNAVLRAHAFDADVIETIHYAWDTMDGKGAWTAVEGATGPQLALGPSAPAAVRLTVDYADAGANGSSAVSSHSIVLATEGADVITSALSSDTVYAQGGDDIISNASRVDGGAGLDTYLSKAALFVYKTDKPGEWRADSTPALFVSYLTNVERVEWGFGAVALDIDGNAGQAFRLYEAAFDRTPDLFGLGFWISRLDLGVSLGTIADAFVASPEFKALYGANPSNAEIVAKFYANILDRAPDPTGVAFWNHVLDTGAATVADVLVEFSESAENIAALVGMVQNGIRYTPYTEM